MPAEAHCVVQAPYGAGPPPGRGPPGGKNGKKFIMVNCGTGKNLKSCRSQKSPHKIIRKICAMFISKVKEGSLLQDPVQAWGLQI